MVEHPIHPAALIFPEMDEQSFQELKADIAAHGQTDPAVLLAGQLLDGRHRQRACRELGLPLATIELHVDNPVAFVMSRNLHRRHLLPGQRAMCAARAREIYEQQAKERRKRKPANSVPANLPEQNGDSRDQVGKSFGVSGRSVDHATKVIKQAIPEVIAAVDTGTISVSAAAKLAGQPQEQQQEEVKKRRAGRPKNRAAALPRQDDDQPTAGQPRRNGRGIQIAYDAVHLLGTIPKNDPERKQAKRIIAEWLKHFKG